MEARTPSGVGPARGTGQGWFGTSQLVLTRGLPSSELVFLSPCCSLVMCLHGSSEVSSHQETKPKDCLLIGGSHLADGKGIAYGSHRKRSAKVDRGSNRYESPRACINIF